MGLRVVSTNGAELFLSAQFDVLVYNHFFGVCMTVRKGFLTAHNMPPTIPDGALKRNSKWEGE